MAMLDVSPAKLIHRGMPKLWPTLRIANTESTAGCTLDYPPDVTSANLHRHDSPTRRWRPHLFGWCVAALLSSATGWLTPPTKDVAPDEVTVYICRGPHAKRYHYTRDCRGLARCSTKIDEVSLRKARELKRTRCGFED